MADIDRLEIGIEAYAGKANSELDKLVRRLEKIEGNLVRINASGLSTNIASTIRTKRRRGNDKKTRNR